MKSATHQAPVGAEPNAFALASVLSSPLRVELLLSLWRAPASLSELAARHQLAAPGLCKQVHILREAGLVEDRGTGQRSAFALTDVVEVIHISAGLKLVIRNSARTSSPLSLELTHRELRVMFGTSEPGMGQLKT